MKKIVLTSLILLSCQTPFAVHLIERSAEEITKIANQDNHTDITFTLGSSFAGHMSNEELIGGKSGISLAWYQASGFGQEIEYIWNPIANSTFNSMRQDMLFGNLILLSSFHSQHIRPHLAVGVGWMQLSEMPGSLNQNSGMSENKKGSLAMQVKAGYEREIAEGLSWGLDYGYIRSLHELSLPESVTRLSAYAFKTQFVNSHISLRF